APKGGGTGGIARSQRRPGRLGPCARPAAGAPGGTPGRPSGAARPPRHRDRTGGPGSGPRPGTGPSRPARPPAPGRGGGGRGQVVVDRDQGVGLDAIAEVSRALSAALDRADEAGAAVMPGEYVLEVSSPGVDRPLTEPRHWRRNVGRLVAVTVAGEGQVTGR